MGAQVSQASETGARSFESFNKRAAAIGAALGTATLALGEFARAAAEDEASTARLQQAIEATGSSYDDYAARVDRVIKQGQDKAYSDDRVRDALVKLTVATGSTQTALDQLGLAMDLARARGIDLSSAADIVGKVYNGNTSILARYGIAVQDGASATEALAQLQTRVAGQADAYANTQAGAADRIRIAWDEATEALGRHSGQLQTTLMLLPGLTSGYTALAAIFAGMGGGPAALALGGAGLAGYLTYDIFANRGKANGPTTADQLYAPYLSAILGGAASLTPFDFGDSFLRGQASQFMGVLDQKTIIRLLAQMVFGASTEEDVARVIVNAVAAGMPAGKVEDIPTKAAAAGLTVEEYVGRYLKQAGYTYVPETGQYMTEQQVLRRRFELAGGYSGPQPGLSSPNAGPGPSSAIAHDVTGRPYIPGLSRSEKGDGYTYARGGGGAVANDLYLAGPMPGLTSTQQLHIDQSNAIAQLREEHSAYLGLVEGINSAHDALAAFKATQDGLLQAEQPYQQQISEYTSQLNAQDAAYQILQQRQAEGQQLTQDQIDFMNNYAEATARGTAGVEDATVAQGMLAQQYLLNMQQGDQLNQTLAGTAGTVDDLTRTIQDLILAMDGVPDEVKTDILLSRADESIADLIAYYNWLNSIPGSVTTVVETVFVSSGDGSGGRFRGGPQAADGATIYAGMRHYSDGGTHALVGERGPELVWLPNGAQVTNTEATQSRLRNRRRERPSIGIYGPLTLQPAGSDAYQALSSVLLGQAR